MSHGAGRTRWKRFAAILVLGVASSATVAVAMAEGVLAASFFISGQKFQVAADKMVTRGVSIYGMVDVTSQRELVPVVVTGARHAKITGLCQSVLIDVPVLGPQTLRVTGGNVRPAQASNLFLDATSQTADEVDFTGLDIGIATGEITKGLINPGDRHSRFFDPNGVGQQADSSTLINVHWTAVAVTAGTFSVPGLRTQVEQGRHECF
ncbi:DUF6230 family protein [Streptomyces sp. NPDC005209]|uniref:DUF6230 family protein n=1 Tax=Streptomyces sp. NPDC005209 TaxID=3156715 RepID=UPI0033A61CD8